MRCVEQSGIPCPEPLEQKEHVLAMTFLGVDGWPSPQLREVKLSSKGWARYALHHLLILVQINHGCVLRLPLVHSSSPRLLTMVFLLVVSRSCYLQLLLLVRSLCLRASLVHGDLSEYNLLWHEGRCVVIDVGQSVHTGHPRADEYVACLPCRCGPIRGTGL